MWYYKWLQYLHYFAWQSVFFTSIHEKLNRGFTLVLIKSPELYQFFLFSSYVTVQTYSTPFLFCKFYLHSSIFFWISECIYSLYIDLFKYRIFQKFYPIYHDSSRKIAISSLSSVWHSFANNLSYKGLFFYILYNFCKFFKSVVKFLAFIFNARAAQWDVH